MFALILWLTLGWRMAAVELLTELALGVMFFGRGGGRCIGRRIRNRINTAIRSLGPAFAGVY